MFIHTPISIHSFPNDFPSTTQLDLTSTINYFRLNIHVHAIYFNGTRMIKCPQMWVYYPWTSYQIRKIAGCACAENAGNVSPRRRFQRKPLVSDSGMHHGTCVTHVPWCMSGSLTCGDGENVPGIPGACAPAILRIWQEAHTCERRFYIEAVPVFWAIQISPTANTYRRG